MPRSLQSQVQMQDLKCPQQSNPLECYDKSIGVTQNPDQSTEKAGTFVAPHHECLVD